MSCIRGDAVTDLHLLHNYYEAPPHSNHDKNHFYDKRVAQGVSVNENSLKV